MSVSGGVRFVKRNALTWGNSVGDAGFEPTTSAV